MQKFLLSITLVALSQICAAQTGASTLEERMPQAAFRAAGLDKLSLVELKYLNEWLAAHGGTTRARAPGDFYSDSGDREMIESHISGDFYGWRGKTVFTLDNGQKWVQAESGQFDVRPLTHPAVKIKPMVLGSWLMYVDGCGCNLRVKRIQ
ncbi:MAG: hypothetical protein WB784_06635 [Rhodanobacteraceae bacterium]